MGFEFGTNLVGTVQIVFIELLFMPYVTPSTQSLKNCFQSHYSLPYFQREYKWESRHFAELLNDIQSAFLLSYEPHHGRTAVASYAPYFLGSIITSAEVDGKKPLIDGQQRLTSTFLILAYLERYRTENNVSNAPDIKAFLGSVSYGVMDYCIEFSATRRAIFDCYLKTSKPLVEAMSDAEDIANLDDGDEKLLEALRTTNDMLDSKVRGAMPYFIDYVLERVLLIDISVASESEAHRVFVTMNDRGLRLGPLDLLKGQILAKIPSPTESLLCHTAWVKTINMLREIDPEEDSLFFRNLFRAKWANTIRGKAKGDAAGDFDVIGDSYHRWFEDNTAKFQIKTSDDYARFAKKDIPIYSDAYAFIKACEATLTSEFEHVHYNAARKYSFQMMVLMAVVGVEGTSDSWKSRVSLIAKFVDLVLTTRAIEGKENNYDNLKELSFALTKQVRDKPEAELLTFIRAEWPKYSVAFDTLDTLKYAKADRTVILYILARIASHLESELKLTNKVGFKTYWQRDRAGKTFDIEHLLKENFDVSSLPATHGFLDEKDYADARNLLGALVLLPRSRNRSLQDKPFREKLPVYATENISAQSLCEALYTNHPAVADYVSAHPAIGLRAISDFGKADIAARGGVYVALAKGIWACP